MGRVTDAAAWLRIAPRRARNITTRAAFHVAVRPKPRRDLIHLGTAYGGYSVPASLLDASSICYSGGVGEDTSFDVELIDRFGCTVFAFDPTPRAIKHAEAVARMNRHFRFLPVGLWSTDTEVKFYVPSNDEHVSHSITNLQRTSSYIVVPVRSLRSVMRELGHTRIDLFKLDIEGAEHEVLRAMLDDGIRPTILCLEFDQPVGVRRLQRSVRRLSAAGYQRVSTDGWNHTFVLSSGRE